eukprot:c7432_g1_i1.p1 GENE.c7432_g1_i1~~c7432_g1_i1.p1  ORF type:complete len:375 (+),score=75.68 c7432_g1_i1:28-1152(+)
MTDNQNEETWAETLGHRPGILSQAEFVGDSSSHDANAIPSAFMWGSFLVQMENAPKSTSEIGLVFYGSQVIGRAGNNTDTKILILGRLCASQNQDGSPTIKLALSLVPILPSANEAPTPTIERMASQRTSTSSADELSSLVGRVEVRASFSPETVADGVGVMSAGFIGEWCELHPQNSTALVRQKVRIYPTPHRSRTGGFYAVEFTGPVCGLEHTGTYSHWHGTGAQIRRVQDPAKSLGVVAGDVIKMINGVPLPHKTCSADISTLLKCATRPLVLHLWRDMQNWTTHPESSSQTASAVLSLPLPAIREAQPTDPNIPLSASSAGESFRESVTNISSRANNLKSVMLDEINKKRKSVDNVRLMRQERHLVSSGS